MIGIDWIIYLVVGVFLEAGGNIMEIGIFGLFGSLLVVFVCGAAIGYYWKKVMG